MIGDINLENDSLLNEEEFTSFIEKTLTRVKTESDINQLNADRKLFRQLVPFGMRSYFASYLIRRIISKGKTNVSNPKRSVPKISFSPEVSTTLFFNIGRMRKVYYRDIIFLIMNNTDVKREDIGEINIHNNYSFVQVSNEVADKIIASLNDFNYRGKKLVVNLANEKTDRTERYESVTRSDEEEVVEKTAD